ncbi:N-acetylglucosamine kinase [Glycomyces xiaoerkulensis]|uniref:N-acetylglucosamine kinase n=1 Tax=Glycomyces xiaoerkulensis TaxID=2038139 RepID=UPI000C25FE5B|nr:BadF/BadG/BcrA/BcrD ATPase family protein [Glycomyces xiaoerkulensis]
MEPLVLGLDVGGTASRAVVTDLDGAVLGSGAAGGGNPITVGPEAAAAQVAAAARSALENLDPARVRSAVMGIAGAGDFGRSETGAAFRSRWDEIGLGCEVAPVGDVVVAFAAGTDRPRGTVLIAGTGAVAAQIEGDRMTRVGDGLGWLLGDRGSGFWIGRSAAVASAEALQAGSVPGELVNAVVQAATGGEEATPDEFAQAVYRNPIRSLAELAPLVDRAARSGDPLAAGILDRAAEHLAETATSVPPSDRDGPIVLSGSVLRECLPVREGVRTRIAALLPGADIRVGGPGELGAARLAARSAASSRD